MRRLAEPETWEFPLESEDTMSSLELRDEEPEGPEAVAAGAAVVSAGFEILKSVLTPMMQGDIQVTWPNSPIGVVWPAKPPGLRLTALTKNRMIIDSVWKNTVGMETVNVKLRCWVQHNGPEVQASFGFDAEGRRSRLGRDTSITVNNPLSLETRPAPTGWQRAGVPEYPVIRIPVEFRINRPWPQDNYNQTFTLILSGMYGFGASASDPAYIKDPRVRWT